MVLDPGRHAPSGVSLELWKEPSGSDKPFAKYVTDTRTALARYRWRIPGETDAQHADRIERVLPHDWALGPA